MRNAISQMLLICNAMHIAQCNAAGFDDWVLKCIGSWSYNNANLGFYAMRIAQLCGSGLGDLVVTLHFAV